MRRREFLAGLLASTAIPRLLPHTIVPGQPTTWAYQSAMTVTAADWSNLKASPLTLEALEELAAAVRASFEPDAYQRHMRLQAGMME
jgi:hypothetical protein